MFRFLTTDSSDRERDADRLERLIAEAALRDEVQWLRKRVEFLTGVIIDMRQEGFTALYPATSRASEEGTPPHIAGAAALPPAIEDAIHEMAAGNPTVEETLREFAAEEHRSGVDPEHVADRIYKGGDVS